jgi:hypothetical protein
MMKILKKLHPTGVVELLSCPSFCESSAMWMGYWLTLTSDSWGLQLALHWQYPIMVMGKSDTGSLAQRSSRGMYERRVEALSE